ncbi:MAG: hypothetical protein OHK0023_24520 [Anaerolineae bacterium]
MDTETLWVNLVTSATIGTSRAEFRLSEADDPALQALLARIDTSNPEKALLEAAAIVSLYRRAARMLPASARALPPTAPSDDLPRMPETAAMMLGRFPQNRTSDWRGLFFEWLVLAFRLQVRALDEDTPYLLTQLNQETPEMRGLGALVVGKRGRWLAELGENSWQHSAFRLEDDETWHTGKDNTRATFLAALRWSDPNRAIELLNSTWQQETAAQRAMWVSICQTNLKPSEQPLLQQWYANETSEKVKQAINHLLMALQAKPLPELEAIAAEALARGDEALSSSHNAVLAIQECKGIWSSAFSETYLRYVGRVLNSVELLHTTIGQEFVAQTFRQLAPSALESAHMSLLQMMQELKQPWMQHISRHYLMLVQLRREMHQAFGTISS